MTDLGVCVGEGMTGCGQIVWEEKTKAGCGKLMSSCSSESVSASQRLELCTRVGTYSVLDDVKLQEERREKVT